MSSSTVARVLASITLLLAPYLVVRGFARGEGLFGPGLLLASVAAVILLISPRISRR